MFSTLFINATILITFLYLGNQFFESTTEDQSIYKKILLGILSGLGGCVLIFYGINLSDKLHIDLRIVAMIVSAIFGGITSNILTTGIIIFFRISYYGVSIISVTASIGLLILLILFSIISSCNISFIKKFSLMSLLNLIYGVVVYSILLSDKALLITALRTYLSATTIVSFLVYYILLHLAKTNELYRKLKDESTRDFLTGLNNVRAFDKTLNELTTDAVKKDEHLSILMIDIDFFKKINDTYGHSSGDLVLKQLSSILVDSCRRFDVVSRNGGEEFTVILLDCTYEKAFEIAERIRQSVENHLFCIENEEKIHITVSIGVSTYPDTTIDINNILSKADDALYNSKRTGRNKVS